ncbi:Short C-terminal domain-containing protein [Streptomyces sp. TLI_053]|uniref:SHOCT domain-containing protein n=1 Tax=Streptomyces sp. TLI_053 TaxID=1855352 RepID=UPI00087D1666|nr:SHOCT domain-containing protein [Streptomyces sp. TLI_053]SDT82926.1 Short C-terminal domain-containing protein [Streptomyces sp. TLI_053]
MDDYPLLNIFLTTMWIFLWILWFMLLFRVFGDLFRDDSVGGWGKAGWCVLLILLPFLGVFVYLIARGKGMGMREAARVKQADAEFRDYVRDAAGSEAKKPSAAGELARLAELRRDGSITEDEYQRAKALVLE